MASNRHLGRVIVLQSLYEYELRTLAADPEVDLNTIIAKNIEPYEKALGDTEFVYNLAQNVVKNFEPLDKALAPMAPEWPISSIAAIDRNVLRMGLYELSECRDTIPPRVAINEAVELAKAFGSDNSSRFINGVLGTAYRKLGIVEEQKDGAKEQAVKKDATDQTTEKSESADRSADETDAKVSNTADGVSSENSER
ncbi:transcription antitermination factor NusB [Candidatus Saccharibacteria bacterium]|nr:transcription antitermination factor NusB [Candidatus Saccharibacteria bacterium]